MKVATWNIPYSFRHASHDDAWNYYLTQIPADYYLFQEAQPPEWVIDNYDIVWAEIGGTRNWGSGIVSEKHPLREIRIDTEFRGAVTVAESNFCAELDLTLISLYGLLEDINGVGYSITNLHRMLSDLTGLLEGRTHGNQDVVLGGDFNASEQIDEVYGLDTHRIFFERLEAFGLTDCFEPFYEDYVQTLRHKRSDRDWQNDYLFISDGWTNSLHSCEVLDNEEIRKYSDHNPVIIQLDIT